MKLNHHAYIIEGFAKEYQNAFLDFFAGILNIDEEAGRTANSSPNFLYIKNNQLDIDDARKIVDFNSQKSFGKADDKKVIFLEINGAGHQAQNALLKTLEEPSSNTYFFIVIPSVSLLLPTIKSRVQVYTLKDFFNNFSDKNIANTVGKNEFNNETDLVVEFLKSNLPKRIEIIKKMIDKSEPAFLVKFLNDLEILTHRLVKEKLKKRLSFNELSALVLSREYFSDQGASKKMLLEFLAIELPVI